MEGGSKQEMQEKKDWGRRFHDGLASLKLTVVILLALAVSSVLGTLLPQGLSDHQLEAAFPRIYWAIDLFSLGDLYHSGWFRFMMGLLCVNLVVCTLKRIPRTLKLLRHREENLSPERLEKFGLHARFETSRSWEDVKPVVEEVVRRHFAPLKSAGAQGRGGVAEKGRWSPWMVYTVHFSVLVVFAGALAGSIWGFNGSMRIHEGDASNVVGIFREQRMVELPFRVRCDDFTVSFYEGKAMPSDFRSDLTLLRGDEVLLQRTIRVNDPLTYEGYTFYQSSYGSNLREAVLEFKDLESGRTETVTLPFQEPRPLPGTDYQVQLVRYEESFSDFGRALGVVIFKEGEEPQGSWILADRPDFHGNRLGDRSVKVASLEETEYTGLQVKKDPGVWIVYLGFVALIVGVGLASYSSHRKVWVGAAGRSPSAEIVLAGRANKNPLSFEREFNALRERLEEELKAEK